VSFVAISRAPLEKIEPFKQRVDWSFKWLSSFHSDFNFDYHVCGFKIRFAGFSMKFYRFWHS
jgi:predicted dithiol-disulfide oxidoreductase (DUF899 family)